MKINIEMESVIDDKSLDLAVLEIEKYQWLGSTFKFKKMDTDSNWWWVIQDGTYHPICVSTNLETSFDNKINCLTKMHTLLSKSKNVIKIK